MEIRSFSSKGVQQDDVWTAADSLIADGLRPTIERVRQKIGRGSPNTVSPMLEAWFATLGTRLGVNKSTEESSDIPRIVQHALNEAWLIAILKSREQSAQEIEHAKATLVHATQELNKRETELNQTELVRAVKHQALEDALQRAKNGTDEALAQLVTAQELACKRELEIVNLHEKLAVIETERMMERHRQQEATAHDLLERKKNEERAQSTQRKFLEEIDQARQVTKKVESDALSTRKQFVAEKSLLLERCNSSEKDLAKIQALCVEKSSDLEALRRATSISDSRSQELQSLLKQQLEDSNNTIARLTEALLNQTNQPARGRVLMARKLNRSFQTRKV